MYGKGSIHRSAVGFGCDSCVSAINTFREIIVINYTLTRIIKER